MKRGNNSQGRYSHPRFQKYLEDSVALDKAVAVADTGGGKELNILFNYNGHTWDAYEVLGLPAGSSLVEVTKAYQQMLKEAAPESQEFLETAFKTILSKK
ncbi:MAG: hypothetical protein ACXVB1_04295 [Pseudobdellovibrionaceae bacterium]